MPNGGILKAMRALNKQEDKLTQALDVSLRGVKAKQKALSKAKEAHGRREAVYRENVKRIKKRAEELNELLGCSKLMERDDPERHRRFLRPVVLQEMGMDEEDGEIEERRVVVRKKEVPRAQRQASRTRFAEQLKKGRASKLRVQSQRTRVFDKADAAKRARTSRKNIGVPNDDDDSDTTAELRRKRRTIDRQPTGSDIQVARDNTLEAGEELEANTGDDPLHSTADVDDAADDDSRRGSSTSGGGLFNFAAVHARMQGALRPATSERGRGDARRGAPAQDSPPQDNEAWDDRGTSPAPETGGRNLEALENAPNRYAGLGGDPEAVDVDALFDDDAALIASDSSDGLFVSERAPTPSPRSSTPEYMLRGSPEPETTRYSEAGSDAHVKGAVTSQKSVASRSYFAKAPKLRQPKNTAPSPPPDAQHRQHQQDNTMASRGADRSPTPPEGTDHPSGESLNPADVAMLSIEGATEDSIKSEDEDDQDHVDANVEHSEPTDLFTFDKYLPAAQGANQPKPGPRPAYAGPTWQERMYRESHARVEDEEDRNVLNSPTEERPNSAISNTVKHPNNRSRLPPATSSMIADNDMIAVRGRPSTYFSDGTEDSPRAEEEYETGEGERESEAAEDPSSGFESTSKPKPKPKKKATGTKKGARKGPRRAPGTRCAECFRLHRKCTHTDPATGAGDDEGEENADPKYLAMRARKRAAQQMGTYMPPPKRTHYNTYGPDPEPVPATYGQQSRNGGVANGLAFDISSVIAGRVLGNAKKRKESEEGTPDRESTPAKKGEHEGDEERKDGGEDDGNEEC